MVKKFDFSGWATKANLKCSDGRTIMPNAFKDDNGKKVPLVWNHRHNDPEEILGHAMLENRPDGVYAYCTFNDTPSGKTARELVKHGDISSLSIYASKLKQNMGNVMHGAIREVSLVLAGANPGAFIESVMMHGEEQPDEGIIYTGEPVDLQHNDENKKQEVQTNMNDEENKDTETKKQESEETVEDVFNTLSEKQKTVVYALIGEALDDNDNNDNDDEEDDEDMKHNLFDEYTEPQDAVLTHADQTQILKYAKDRSIGTLQNAIDFFKDQNELQHGFEEIELLFPEFKDVRPGAPELITRDQGWVDVVMSKIQKSPISRIRTRQADVRGEDFEALGYKRGTKKKNGANIKLLKRTTDPQTVYRKDALHRDDIIDITEFDVVEYQYGIMRQNLNEEIAKAIMIGDGRDEADEDKIQEGHIRPIWLDNELYTIHTDVDVAAARTELQGTDTAVHFGDNYVYAEAIITASLYSREKYKGSGTPDFFCTPHLLNVMLLARDLNGRRIYDSKTDLAAALNVGEIHTAEQFEGKTRVNDEGDTKKLLGIFVNLSDYQAGSTKGGEITRFNQFDIDFNQEKYLIETRLSGALTRIYSAIALEEPVTTP